MFKKTKRIYVIIIGIIVVILCSYIKSIKSLAKEGFESKSDETACEFVSSLGVLKSTSVHSSNPVSSIKVVEGYDFSKIKEGSTVYITGSAIPDFIKKIASIPHKFVLVSGDCDETIYKDVFPSSHEFINFIEQDKIIHWFSQNCTVSHPKISRIPIGLDYHTLSRKSHSWGHKLTPVEQESMLKTIATKAVPFYKRKISCYSNFHFSNAGKFGHERSLAVKEIPGNLITYEANKVERKSSWEKQSEYAFAVSPPGHGLDCHRTWEALCLGCIPIVKRSPLDPLYEDLPVLIVDSWSDINIAKLETVVQDFKNRKFNYDKLKLSYWMNKINSVASVNGAL